MIDEQQVTDDAERLALTIRDCLANFEAPVHLYIKGESARRWEESNPDSDWHDQPESRDDLIDYKIIANAVREASITAANAELDLQTRLAHELQVKIADLHAPYWPATIDEHIAKQNAELYAARAEIAALKESEATWIRRATTAVATTNRIQEKHEAELAAARAEIAALRKAALEVVGSAFLRTGLRTYQVEPVAFIDLQNELARLRSAAPSDDRIREFVVGILHGDEEHRAWLREAGEAFIEGAPLPVPRSRGSDLRAENERLMGVLRHLKMLVGSNSDIGHIRGALQYALASSQPDAGARGEVDPTCPHGRPLHQDCFACYEECVEEDEPFPSPEAAPPSADDMLTEEAIRAGGLAYTGARVWLQAIAQPSGNESADVIADALRAARQAGVREGREQMHKEVLQLTYWRLPPQIRDEILALAPDPKEQ